VGPEIVCDRPDFGATAIFSLFSLISLFKVIQKIGAQGEWKKFIVLVSTRRIRFRYPKEHFLFLRHLYHQNQHWRGF
jgi:hypothetical protein